MTTKLTATQIALTHTDAFVQELNLAADKEYDDGPQPKATQRPKAIIKMWADYLSTLDGSTPEQWRNLLQTFLDDMTKVTEVRQGRGDQFLEHGGTECRGWFRVWQTFGLQYDMTMPDHKLLNPGYYSSFDLGRDADMLSTFRDAGVIQQHQYQRLVTLRTMKHLIHNDMDATKTAQYWNPQYINDTADLALLAAVHQSTHHSTRDKMEMLGILQFA